MASRSWPGPGCARSPSPAAPSATISSSRPPKPPASRCTSPASGTSTTDAEDALVTAQELDGTALAAEIRADLTQRVTALAARTPAAAGGQGSTVPGLGTVLVGDDPGGRPYVNGKHRDCAQGGRPSIRRDLPAPATPPPVEAAPPSPNPPPP